MKLQLIKQQYKDLLHEIASISIGDGQYDIMLQLLPKLTGYLVLIDLLENKDIANYDPIVENDNGFILESVGLLLLSNTREQQEMAVSNLIDNINHNFISHYQSHIEFDLQDASDAINQAYIDDIEYDLSMDHISI